jgi:hypothetical protein
LTHDEPTVDPAIAARILSSTDLDEEETEDMSEDDRIAEDEIQYKTLSREELEELAGDQNK